MYHVKCFTLICMLYNIFASSYKLKIYADFHCICCFQIALVSLGSVFLMHYFASVMFTAFCISCYNMIICSYKFSHFAVKFLQVTVFLSD